jgi:hypothetical protein
MFSATDRLGNSEKSWKMTAIPAAAAAMGVIAACGTPSRAITPRSGFSTPARSLISVDLPEPFSPARHTASPARITKSTPSRAVIPA